MFNECGITNIRKVRRNIAETCGKIFKSMSFSFTSRRNKSEMCEVNTINILKIVMLYDAPKTSLMYLITYLDCLMEIIIKSNTNVTFKIFLIKN